MFSGIVGTGPKRRKVLRNPRAGDVVYCYIDFRARPRPNSPMPEGTSQELFTSHHPLIVLGCVPATEPWKVISQDRTHDVELLLPNGSTGYVFSDHLDPWVEDETDA